MEKEIRIQTGKVILAAPVTLNIVKRSVALLNLLFNHPQFKEDLCKQSFVKTNRPGFGSTNEISGKSVYDDFADKGVLEINLTIKSLRNPWTRFVSKTYGVTDSTGNSIVTYTWWLSGLSEAELVKQYAVHVGHEIFHTHHLQYIHDPEVDSRHFQKDKDVAYQIDFILENILKRHYPSVAE